MPSTKERIIAVAYDLFAEKGYNATLEEIAKAVGIRTPSIYSHFKSKEELFLVVICKEIDEYFRGFEEELEMLSGENINKQIKGLFFSVIAYFKQKGRTRFWRSIPLIPQNSLRNQCRELILQNDQTFTLKMIDMFKEGVRRKELRPTVTESSVFLLLAMIQGILDGMLLYDEDELFFDRFAERTWEAFWDGVKAE